MWIFLNTLDALVPLSRIFVNRSKRTSHHNKTQNVYTARIFLASQPKTQFIAFALGNANQNEVHNRSEQGFFYEYRREYVWLRKDGLVGRLMCGCICVLLLTFEIFAKESHHLSFLSGFYSSRNFIKFNLRSW